MMEDEYYIGQTEYLIRETRTGYRVLEILNLDREYEEVFSGTYEQCRAWLENRRDKAINDEY